MEAAPTCARAAQQMMSEPTGPKVGPGTKSRSNRKGRTAARRGRPWTAERVVCSLTQEQERPGARGLGGSAGMGQRRPAEGAGPSEDSVGPITALWELGVLNSRAARPPGAGPVALGSGQQAPGCRGGAMATSQCHEVPGRPLPGVPPRQGPKASSPALAQAGAAATLVTGRTVRGLCHWPFRPWEACWLPLLRHSAQAMPFRPGVHPCPLHGYRVFWCLFHEVPSHRAPSMIDYTQALWSRQGASVGPHQTWAEPGLGRAWVKFLCPHPS